MFKKEKYALAIKAIEFTRRDFPENIYLDEMSFLEAIAYRQLGLVKKKTSNSFATMNGNGAGGNQNKALVREGDKKLRELMIKQDKDGKRESDWSATKSFLVAQTTVPEADFNGDGMIDIRDWSVFLSRWNEKSDARKVLDLNHNGKVDISDASIFLQSLKMKK